MAFHADHSPAVRGMIRCHYLVCLDGTALYDHGLDPHFSRAHADRFGCGFSCRGFPDPTVIAGKSKSEMSNKSFVESICPFFMLIVSSIVMF